MSNLDEDDYEVILEDAYKMYRASERARGGVRGQTITVYDSIDFWVMKATEDFIRTRIIND